MLSRRLLARESLTLYMVDSWAPVALGSPYAASIDPQKGRPDMVTRFNQAQQDAFYAEAASSVAFAGKRAFILPMTSAEAARVIQDGTLDFVFVDADHSYEGCSADIDAWLPKLKDGGLMMGHDYHWDGVRRAVNERFIIERIMQGGDLTWCVRI